MQRGCNYVSIAGLISFAYTPKNVIIESYNSYIFIIFTSLAHVVKQQLTVVFIFLTPLIINDIGYLNELCWIILSLLRTFVKVSV